MEFQAEELARAETLVCSNKASVAGLQLEKGSIVGKERSVRYPGIISCRVLMLNKLYLADLNE